LEKKCKLLEETIKSKNPNSIPMMLQQVKDNTQQDKAEVSELKNKIKQLEVIIDEKDKDYEKRLRALRQEAERVKEQFEGKKGTSVEAKKVAELEKEIETTKNYYLKRIRELEDKYKFKVPEKDKKVGSKVPPKKEDAPA
jgi:CHAT domain-containing protein